MPQLRHGLSSLSDQARFAIMRLSAIGDTIHTLPVAHALRARYPRSHITWVTQAGPASLLEGVSAIDDLVVVPKDWLKSWKAIREVRRLLRSARLDVCIDAQSLTKSSALGWLAGAPIRIGFAKPQGRELSRLFNNLLVTPTAEHVVDRYIELLGPLGVSRPEISFDMPICSTSRERRTQFLRACGCSTRFAAINTGAGWDSKRWPTERFAAVARYLDQRHGMYNIVFWAGEREQQLASEIMSLAGGRTALAPATSLPDLREFLRAATIFVGSDTGPMHLAVAVGTPTVSIFGPTDPRRNGPYGKGHVALHRPSSTTKNYRSDDNRAMLAITADEVLDACDMLLRQTASRVA
jgi:lipopolysaccharide heptosyltransferase I